MFWKKKTKLAAPVTGQVVQQGKIPDPVFSGGMMGAAIAIIPEGNELVAPADAVVVSANPGMKHAIGLRLSDGCELLLHIGIDTVSMGNKGFETLVSEGESVTAGQSLVRFDSSLIKAEGLSDMVILIVTDAKGREVSFTSDDRVQQSDSTVGDLK